MKLKIQLIICTFLTILISCNTSKYKLSGLDENTYKKDLDYRDYYLKMYKADSLFLLNDFKGSYKILDSLFKIYEPLDTDSYGEYGIYLSSAVMSGHLKDIDKKARFGYTHFGGISPLHKEYFVDKINLAANISEEEVGLLKKVYYESLNLPLREKMLKMFEEDQAVRNNEDEITINKVDARNIVELEGILSKYGYPVSNLIGGPSALELSGGDIHEAILFVHLPNDYKKKYLPILLENVIKGKCDPDTYAFVYDRLMMDQYEKQYYGTYTCGNSSNLCELINPIKLDSIRASIGLPHIEYYPWRLKQFAEKE